jgi:hypothetical protein
VVPPDCLVVSVTVTPASVTMHLRDTTLLHGSGTTQCPGRVVTVRWRLSDSTVAAIALSTDSTATLIARGSGSTTVFATAVQDPAVSRAVSVNVVP